MGLFIIITIITIIVFLVRHNTATELPLLKPLTHI